MCAFWKVPNKREKYLVTKKAIYESTTYELQSGTMSGVQVLASI